MKKKGYKFDKGDEGDRRLGVASKLPVRKVHDGRWQDGKRRRDLLPPLWGYAPGAVFLQAEFHADDRLARRTIAGGQHPGSDWLYRDAAKQGCVIVGIRGRTCDIHINSPAKRN
ncbi:hypothetical protein [Paracoccus actinidiae]|uniref:hypothetical protein n=1 Tax=Paracoccus actinidiae TaxID=3064531 RepID=UPI0027D231B1|nr:hypothetical protein [Paracoccus sp. M09]